MGWSPLRRESSRPLGHASSFLRTRHATAAVKKAEDAVIEATKAWTKDILPNWSPKTRSSRKVRDIWWQGVPPSLREKVWQLAIGNELNLTHELFEICVQRSKERVWTQLSPLSRPLKESKSKESLSAIDYCSAGSTTSTSSSNSSTSNCHSRSGSSGIGSMDSRTDNLEAKELMIVEEDSDEETVADLIRLDVSRTFPHLGLFQEDGPYHEHLIDVLGAYVTYRPDINYVQGMAFLAGMLLLNMSKADAFVSFGNMLNTKSLMSFYRMDQRAMAAYYDTHRVLLRENCPQLAEHFEREGLTPDLYLIDWIYSLFARSLPLDVTARLWDVFLRDGDEMIFRAALGLLNMYTEVLTKLDFMHLAMFLTKLPEGIASEPEKLFDSIATIKMTSDKLSFQQIFDKFYANSSSSTMVGSNASLASRS